MSKAKTFLLAILFSWAAQGLFSAPISIEKARQVAKNLHSEVGMALRRSTSDDNAFSNVIRIGDEQQPLMYAFNLPDNAGFIIIAGDDASFPVLGYTQKGNFSANPEDRPEGFNFFMRSYEQQLSAIRDLSLSQSPAIKAEWDRYLKDPFTIVTGIDGVDPLVTRQWDQNRPYNDLIPEDSEGRTLPAGCSGIASAQIVNIAPKPFVFNKYDMQVIEAIASSGKKSVHMDSIGFHVGDSILFNFNNMPDIATEENHDEIAKLILCTGVAAQTKFSYGGSSAYITPVRDAMVDRFGYSPNAEVVHKANYTDVKWSQLLRAELNAHRPVYYIGRDTVKNVGHAFVCDGYQNNNYFHINWGWAGMYNGYFYLSDLSPSTYDFGAQQGAIIGLMPDTVKRTPPLHLKARTDSSNVDLSWTTPSAKPITEWMHYDTSYHDRWRFGANPNYKVAIRFDTAQLATYHGLTLTKIRIIAAKDAADYRLKVWKGKNASLTLVDQAISVKSLGYWESFLGDSIYEYNTYILDQPVVIDASEELWIGYSIENQRLGKYPVGVDKGPAIAGYGDMLCYEGGYWCSAHLLYPECNFNWTIQAFVTDVYGNASAMKSLPAKRSLDNIVSAEIRPEKYEKPVDPAEPFGSISQDSKPGEDYENTYTANAPLLLGYNIYREGKRVNSQLVTQSTYSDKGLAAGTYIYSVTAVYNSGPSVLSGPAKATVGNKLNQPLKLQADILNRDVHLSWRKPLPSLKEEWIQYDDGNCFIGIGFTNGGSFKVAIRYTPEQLKKFAGMYISKVKLYTCGSNSKYQLFIAKGVNASTVMNTIPIASLKTNQWDIIELAQPVPIDINQELWIGYKVIDQPAGEYPAGVDNGPGTIGYSDMICTDGFTFVTLQSLNAEWNYNWNIQALLTNQQGTKRLLSSALPASRRLLLGYNLYRNYARINSSAIVDTTWRDIGLPLGTYDYYVKALYDDGESGPSNIVTAPLIFTTVEAIEIFGAKFYPNPASNFVMVETPENFNEIHILSIAGNEVYQYTGFTNHLKISTKGFIPGMYVIQVKTGAKTISRRITVK